MAPMLALVGGAFAGLHTGASLLYGSLTALAVTAVLVWREQQAARHPEWDPHRLLKQFMRTGIERLVVLIALLAAGFGVLQLAPLPLLLGLLLAQSAWLAVVVGRQAK